MRFLPFILLCSACLASQEIRGMHRELNVQIEKLSEAVGKEATARRDETQKLTESMNKAIAELRETIAQSRGAVETEIQKLEDKVEKLSAIVTQLQKGVRLGSTAVSFSDLEVRAVGENHYRISRKQFSEQAYELLRLLTQVQLAANFDGDKVMGMRIVDGNGMLERFGILAGDVVLKVGNTILTDAKRAPDIVRDAAKASVIPVEVRRGGKKLIFRISVGE